MVDACTLRCSRAQVSEEQYAKKLASSHLYNRQLVGLAMKFLEGMKAPTNTIADGPCLFALDVDLELDDEDKLVVCGVIARSFGAKGEGVVRVMPAELIEACCDEEGAHLQHLGQLSTVPLRMWQGHGITLPDEWDGEHSPDPPDSSVAGLLIHDRVVPELKDFARLLSSSRVSVQDAAFAREIRQYYDVRGGVPCLGGGYHSCLVETREALEMVTLITWLELHDPEELAGRYGLVAASKIRRLPRLLRTVEELSCISACSSSGRFPTSVGVFALSEAAASVFLRTFRATASGVACQGIPLRSSLKVRKFVIDKQEMYAVTGMPLKLTDISAATMKALLASRCIFYEDRISYSEFIDAQKALYRLKELTMRHVDAAAIAMPGCVPACLQDELRSELTRAREDPRAVWSTKALARKQPLSYTSSLPLEGDAPDKERHPESWRLAGSSRKELLWACAELEVLTTATREMASDNVLRRALLAQHEAEFGVRARLREDQLRAAAEQRELEVRLAERLEREKSLASLGVD
jgi:hypothetical protein